MNLCQNGNTITAHNNIYSILSNMKGGFNMSKKGLKLGVALAAGAGAAALLKKTSQEKHTTSDSAVKSGVSH